MPRTTENIICETLSKDKIAEIATNLFEGPNPLVKNEQIVSVLCIYAATTDFVFFDLSTLATILLQAPEEHFDTCAKIICETLNENQLQELIALLLLEQLGVQDNQHHSSSLIFLRNKALINRMMKYE